jgi:hypothetical protein
VDACLARDLSDEEPRSDEGHGWLTHRRSRSARAS